MEEQNKTQCDNCLKVFKYYCELERHMLSLRPCKKVYKDDNGNIISTKKFKCEDCDELFMYDYTLMRHKRDSCKGNKIIPSVINNTNNTTDNSTNSTDNSTTNNITNNNSVNLTDNSITNNNNTTNVAITLGLLNKHLHPPKDFEGIEDDFINVINIEKYISIFYKNPIKLESMFHLIKEILTEKYVGNIALGDRNIMTISSRNKMHYYKNKKWKKDSCNDYFSKECIIKIIKQMQNAISDKMQIVCKIRNDDIKSIHRHNFNMEDKALNEIVATKKYNLIKKIVNEAINHAHDKDLDKRWKFYEEIINVLKSSELVKRVLGLMKEKLNTDDDFREMLQTLSETESLPNKNVIEV